MENKLPERKSTRLKDFDYGTTGAYFITICTENRKPILSDIINPVGVGAYDDPQVRLTKIGKIVEKNLLSSENISGVKINQYVIMPNHIHAIIFLDNDEFANRKNGSSRAPTPTNEMLPHIVSTFKRFCNKEIGYNVFQRSFHDHVIRDREDYENIVKYIHDNPMNWHFDELYSEETF